MIQALGLGHPGQSQTQRHKHMLLVKVWRGVGVVAHVVVWAALASIVVQLLYPPDRALPGTSLNGQAVGGMTEEKLLENLDKLAADAEIRIITPAKTRQIPWATTGITMDRLATAEMVMQYDWWERLVPFSSLALMAQDGYQPLVIVDEERLNTFAATIAKNDQQKIKEASVTIDGGEVKADLAKAGYSFSREDIKHRLLSEPFTDGAQVVLRPESTPANHQPREVNWIVERAKDVISQDVTLYFNGQTLSPDQKDISGWIEIKEDPNTKKLRLVVDDAGLQNYLETQNSRYANPPKPIRVTLLDGKEIKRTTSESGFAMDVERAAKTLERLVLDATPGIIAELPVTIVEPEVIYKRTYSKTSKGLDALIRHWEATTYGNYGIIVQEIGGKNRRAQFGAEKRFVTASTFKLFLTYAVFTQVEAGKMELSESSGLEDWTVDQCVTEMIINSTNPCAEALQNKIGQATIQKMLQNAGFNETEYNNAGGGDKYSSIGDEADFLLRLYGGTLFNKHHTNKLLSLMKRQIWRGGIPAGVPEGTTVANKVGFYNGWIHDVGIVYSPKATYIFVVMSRGGSDPVFAELSRQVYDFFNR